MSDAQPTSYSGWQHERSGWVGNLSGPGMIMLAAAVGLLLVPLYQRTLLSLIFIPIAALMLALAYGRVLGLAAEEWILLAVRHQIAVAKGTNVFTSGAAAPRSRATGAQPMDLPGQLARIRFLAAPDGLGGELGVVHDPNANTYSAVLRVTHPGLALVDTAQQNARVAAWGALLRSYCTEDGAIIRIGVHQRCLPDDGTALESWTAQHTSPDAPPEAIEAIREVMYGAGPSATSRETYLTLTMSASRARLAVKGAGGGQVGAAAVLVRELGAMQGTLGSAGLQVVEQLDQRGLAQVVRTAYDPHEQVTIAARNAAAATPGWEGTPRGVDPDLAGPATAVTEWGVYQHDGAWTVTYAVRGLPHGEVYATVLQPLMRPRTTARRSLTMVYEPIGPREARRQLSAERTKRDASRRLRAKTGKVDSEDQIRELMVAHSQDIARSQGQGVVRLTAMIAVTVTDLEQLETACAELQADASAAGLELRKTWGAMDDGFAVAALPLALGLPDRRSMF
ncbi:SCO6880 family protein [Streptomyces sp. G-5]|uniref:SCO6880 family protein n=1 Tax=Streptomyces sp. G-5 TaxID=2977231 RepID=UPI0021D2F90A|nr:SCO6880 family protein [Streptomyces sp. G-5]MCU4750298.1 PrgI family protein [Streptomyces sp. G-5]